eukprot:362056-Chlamydomonas_euryale.AAC.2
MPPSACSPASVSACCSEVGDDMPLPCPAGVEPCVTGEEAGAGRGRSRDCEGTDKEGGDVVRNGGKRGRGATTSFAMRAPPRVWNRGGRHPPPVTGAATLMPLAATMAPSQSGHIARGRRGAPDCPPAPPPLASTRGRCSTRRAVLLAGPFRARRGRPSARNGNSTASSRSTASSSSSSSSSSGSTLPAAALPDSGSGSCGGAVCPSLCVRGGDCDPAAPDSSGASTPPRLRRLLSSPPSLVHPSSTSALGANASARCRSEAPSARLPAGPAALRGGPDVWECDRCS